MGAGVIGLWTTQLRDDSVQLRETLYTNTNKLPLRYPPRLRCLSLRPHPRGHVGTGTTGSESCPLRQFYQTTHLRPGRSLSCGWLRRQWAAFPSTGARKPSRVRGPVVRPGRHASLSGARCRREQLLYDSDPGHSTRWCHDAVVLRRTQSDAVVSARWS